MFSSSVYVQNLRPLRDENDSSSVIENLLGNVIDHMENSVAVLETRETFM